MKILLDECVPWPMHKLLAGHDCTTAQKRGWGGVENGELLGLAEGEYDLFITSDQNVRYQQNLAGRKVAIWSFRRTTCTAFTRPRARFRMQSTQPKRLLFCISPSLKRKYRNFRAVWIFRSLRGYQFLVLMEPRDDATYHEFNMVIAAARSREDDIGHGLVDETDPVYIANLFRQAASFYVAADFAQPRSQ